MNRHLASFLATCIAGLSLPIIPGASAAPGVPAAEPESQRFLFIMDMSSGMERLKEANETAIYELLRTGLFGQMRAGDTYGLWTFDKETHVGKFPVAVWDARRASQLGVIAAAYLSNHHYENSGDVKRMTELLTTVVQDARDLNVFIISDGGSAMRGTPFDKAINTEYRKKRRDRSSAKQPFVTTLIARGGSMTNYSVVIAGQPIPLPERPLPAVAVATNAAPPTNRPAGVLLAVTPVTPGSASAAPATNLPNQANPVPSSAAITALAQPPVNAAAKSEAKGPRVLQITTRSNHVPAEVQPGPPEPAKTSVALVPEAAPANSAPPALPTPASTPPAPASVVVPRSVLEAVLPEPVTVAARELSSEPGPVAPAPPATVQAAALPVAPAGPGAGLFLTFGSLLMAAAFFLLFVVFRRHRPAPGASLITQSMERR